MAKSIVFMIVAIFRLTSLFSIILVNNAFAMSAHRHLNEKYESALKRSLSADVSITAEKNSAMNVAKSFKTLDYKKVPQVKTLEALNKAFIYLRDVRFMKNIWEDDLRRLSWFYPDNGCWLKAELMKENLRKHNKIKVGKVFAFGELSTKTEYSPIGEVSWWYHVAPILRVEKEVYVLDPTINHHRPLKITEWSKQITADTKTSKFSYCHANTFSPKSRCKNRVKEIQALVKSTQQDYLTKEKKRLIELGLKPEVYLGDNPPW